MIEVNLYSVAVQDPNPTVGRCIARNRFDKEGMGVSIMEFVKGFLQNNLSSIEVALGNADLIGIINSESVMSTHDFASINYCLQQVGYMVQIQNVADDEDNAIGVPSGEVVEWNVIDRNFVQYDYPTATKIIPADGLEIPAILKQVVDQCGLFDSTRFSGVKNPFTELINGLESIKRINGTVSSSLTSQIYQLLDQMGISLFCATSED